MSSDIAIKVENLSKCYQIYDTPRDRLKQFVYPKAKGLVAPIGRLLGSHSPLATRLAPRNYYKEFWALKDVSFEVKKGETVGIIGRNGSGKSTLLQMICGTLTPTSGSVQTNGRIAALLELGSGFNPEFNGRENVYMNASILGLSQDEIDARFDDIAAFADIGEFIEQPVKTYSSGMFVRLAFAVNIMSQPEIMIVDEALAVGDMAFQAKCMTALRRIQDAGATILFVSHDLGSVKSLCDQAVYLEAGTVQNFGKASTVAEHYTRVMREEMNAQNVVSSPITGSKLPATTSAATVHKSNIHFKTSEEFEQRSAQFRYGSGGARICFAELLDMDDQPVVSATFDQQVKVRIHFTAEIENILSVNYYIHDDKKNSILGASLRVAGVGLLHCKAHSKYIVTYTTNLPLQEGNYSIHIELTAPVVLDQTAKFLDVVDDAIVFNVCRRENGRLWARVYVNNTVNIESM